jgi:F-type H+-transporting ATPase subunit g
VYNSKVAAELMKQVYVREQMQLPKIEQWPEAKKQWQELLHIYSSGAYREWTLKELLQRSLVAAEIMGFFVIGEMIGRRSIIGYNIQVADKDHHH